MLIIVALTGFWITWKIAKGTGEHSSVALIMGLMIAVFMALVTIGYFKTTNSMHLLDASIPPPDPKVEAARVAEDAAKAKAATDWMNDQLRQ